MDECAYPNNINHLELTYTAEILMVLFFGLLLSLAIILLGQIYICDNSACKSFQEAVKAGELGSKPYVLLLVNSLFDDGIWPVAYIASAILTPLSLYFLRFPITIYTFSILFFISFATMYFVFLFIIHHYVRFITGYVDNYIENNCPATPTLTTVEQEEAITPADQQILEPE